MDKKLLGYLFMFVAVICGALAPVFAKIVQQTMSIESSSFYWFMSALVWSTIILLLTNNQKHFITSTKKYWKRLLVFGICNGLGVLLWWFSLRAIGAAPTAFLNRSETIFLLILGFVLLKERFNRYEILGIVMAVLGVFVFTYTPTTIFNLASLYIIIGSFVYSFGQIIAKNEIKRINPIVLVFVRALATFIFLTFYLFAVSRPEIPTTKSIIILIIFPLFTAVLQHIFMYKGFQHLDISKAGVVLTLLPPTAWLLAWLILGETLTPLQILGGALILIGVAVMVFFKNAIKRRSK